jgi:hypothetical protein
MEGEEEEDAAPPTGCWIRLPRLGGGCMSSGSKVDSSTSGACGTRSRGKMLPRSSSTSRLFISPSASLRSSGGQRLRVRLGARVCWNLRLGDRDGKGLSQAA